MIRGHAGRQLLDALLTFFCLTAVSFFLLHVLPGGPFDQEEIRHPHVQLVLENEWGLRKPLFEQFFSYTEKVFWGDLGHSLSYPNKKVMDLIWDGFSQSILLNSVALVVVVLLGLLWALLLVFSEGHVMDALLAMFLSMPSLVVGPLLIWIFSVYLGVLPSAFLDSPMHYILPVLALALRPAASLGRILGESLREIITKDYIRTARAKGLSKTEVILKHGLPNSVMPAMGYFGPLVMSMISGSFVIEILFSIKGLGHLFVDGVAARDYSVVMGLVLFYGWGIVLVDAVIEIGSQWLDPRLRAR